MFFLNFASQSPVSSRFFAREANARGDLLRSSE